MMEPVAAKAHELPWQEQEAAELRAELHLMKTAGIIEVAVRNPSVAEYMAHWEGRALAAEALLKEAGPIIAALLGDLEARAVTLKNGTKQVSVSDGVYHRALAVSLKIGGRNVQA